MLTLNNLINDELNNLRNNLIARTHALGKRATGRTASSIETRITGEGSGELILPEWFHTLETGRPPANGKSQSNPDDFTANLREWIVAKRIPYKNEADLERLAKFFRWYINRFGTRQYRKGNTNDILSPAINEFTERLEKRLSEAMVEQIKNVFDK